MRWRRDDTGEIERAERKRPIDPEEFLARVRERRERMTMGDGSTEDTKAAYDEDLERRWRVVLNGGMDVEVVENED